MVYLNPFDAELAVLPQDVMQVVWQHLESKREARRLAIVKDVLDPECKGLYLTMLGCLTDLSRTTSRSDEAGSPWCLRLNLIFLRASFIFFSLSYTSETIPKVPSPMVPKNWKRRARSP